MAESYSAPAPAGRLAAPSWKRHVRFRWSLLLLFCFVVGGAVGWVVRCDRVAWARRSVLQGAITGDVATLRKCIRIDPGMLGVIEDLGTSALHAAAWPDRLAALRILLDAGAEIDLRDAFERTPLHVAASSRSGAAVKMLVARGADAKARDVHGRTPLHFAARSGAGKAIEMLVAAGADVNAADVSGGTPLHEAAGHRRGGPVIPRLVELGARLNARDSDGRTALALAAATGNSTSVRDFLRAGADPGMADDEGLTPLHLALLRLGPGVYGGDAQGTVRALLSAGAQVNGRAKDGRTPLHIACACCPGGLVDLLLQSGADVTAADGDGNTPLHVLAGGSVVLLTYHLLGDMGYTPLPELFDRGADPLAKNKAGKTPVDLARERGQTRLVRLLEAAAAKKRPAPAPRR